MFGYEVEQSRGLFRETKSRHVKRCDMQAWCLWGRRCGDMQVRETKEKRDEK
jgi:hypothetical protein